MQNFKHKLYRFMYGRYGMDKLNTFLLYFITISLFINLFFIRNYFISIALWICFIVYFFRIYSRNITRRRKENEIFLKMSKPIRKRYSLLKKQRQDRI